MNRSSCLSASVSELSDVARSISGVEPPDGSLQYIRTYPVASSPALPSFLSILAMRGVLNDVRQR